MTWLDFLAALGAVTIAVVAPKIVREIRLWIKSKPTPWLGGPRGYGSQNCH